eukprot:scaffold2603_cov100-Isochrysis_galbana.AAC.7
MNIHSLFTPYSILLELSTELRAGSTPAGTGTQALDWDTGHWDWRSWRGWNSTVTPSNARTVRRSSTSGQSNAIRRSDQVAQIIIGKRLASWRSSSSAYAYAHRQHHSS